jgi:hypothetical protein
MPITRLSNIDQFRYICGNVSPDINIKIRACDFSVNTKSAFLQCDGYTKIYTLTRRKFPKFYRALSNFLQFKG